MAKLQELPSLLVVDVDGRLMAHPTLKVAARSARDIVEALPEDFIPLPEGSELFGLPGRLAIGFDHVSGEFVPVDEGPEGQPVRPAAAFVAPAHTSLLMPAYVEREGAPKLPLFAYTCVGELDGKYYAAAVRTDLDVRQDPALIDEDLVQKKIKAALKGGPENRLLTHLAHCALDNKCAAAKNYFLGRFEVPLPSSPSCNADCVGCLSFQPPEAGFPSTQNRLLFSPTATEIAEIAVPHLESSERPVASFGQGCEGEPLNQAELLEAAIRAIRARTPRGIINVNSNGSRPAVVRRLLSAGLDAIRVSLNSAQEPWYNAYYRPKDYKFSELTESLRAVADAGGKASINYFVFPGVSDREAEIEALLKLIKETGLHLIQWRNLNLDPELYLKTLGKVEDAGPALGIKTLLDEVKLQFPEVRYGYFNPAWGYDGVAR